jgi:hypothetical protein
MGFSSLQNLEHLQTANSVAKHPTSGESTMSSLKQPLFALLGPIFPATEEWQPQSARQNALMA